MNRKVCSSSRGLKMDAIHVTPELEGGWSWAGDWAATPTLHRALGGISGGEGWAVKIGPTPDDRWTAR
jgi:hypothetical protein